MNEAEYLLKNYGDRSVEAIGLALKFFQIWSSIIPVLLANQNRGNILNDNKGGSVVHIKYKCVCRYRQPGWKRIAN